MFQHARVWLARNQPQLFLFLATTCLCFLGALLTSSNPAGEAVSRSVVILLGITGCHIGFALCKPDESGVWKLAHQIFLAGIIALYFLVWHLSRDVAFNLTVPTAVRLDTTLMVAWLALLGVATPCVVIPLHRARLRAVERWHRHAD